MRTLVAAAVILGCSVACNFSENRAQAENAVALFHTQLNDGKLEDIYQSASDAFRSSGSKTDFVAYLEAVRKKLGQFKSSETTFVNVNSTTGGTFVSLNLQSTFEQDVAAEEFTFVVSQGRPVLQRYNINSKTLVVK